MPVFRRSRTSQPADWENPDLVQRVCRQIRTNLTFTRGYSPLYSEMLRCCLNWLKAPQDVESRLDAQALAKVKTLGPQLIAFASQDGRSPLQLNLGFAAALHAHVLAEDPRLADLSTYYPSVGGERSPTGPGFERALLDAMASLGPALFEAASGWTVQTNETSRGLAWLLPATILGIRTMHLVELGASAGLNLYAEQRRFALKDQTDQTLAVLGAAQEPQFEIPVQLTGAARWPNTTSSWRVPQIHSRVGADLKPIELASIEDERRLEACVWGDQPHRIHRLREGIDIHRRAQEGGLQPAAELFAARFPEDLEPFLARAIPDHPAGPVVVYNTYVTEYFNDVEEGALARTMRDCARRWSLQYRWPCMWIRFEPPRSGEPPAPERGWCRWDVELFSGAEHRVLQLGWAHPHFRGVRLGDGFAQLLQLA